jgi:hypothetical protein
MTHMTDNCAPACLFHWLPIITLEGAAGPMAGSAPQFPFPASILYPAPHLPCERHLQYSMGLSDHLALTSIHNSVSLAAGAKSACTHSSPQQQKGLPPSTGQELELVLPSLSLDPPGLNLNSGLLFSAS